jgi:hypothetical protein
MSSAFDDSDAVGPVSDAPTPSEPPSPDTPLVPPDPASPSAPEVPPGPLAPLGPSVPTPTDNFLHTFIDGVDVSRCVIEGSVVHWLNKKYTATVKMPMDCAVEGIGKKLLIYCAALDKPIDFHGFIKLESLEAGEVEDSPTDYVEYNAEGIDELWEARPARDMADGNYIKPNFLVTWAGPGLIMYSILYASEHTTDVVFARSAEGPLFIEYGDFPLSGADLSGAPADWPMTIAQIRDLLCSTGACDVVVTPIDSGGNMGRVDVYNGNYGTDLTGSTHYHYGTGGNVKYVRRTRDLAAACNKLRYLLGPRLDDMHWQRSVEGTNSDMIAAFPGPMATVLALREASQAAIGVRFDLHTYDNYSAEANAVPLYWKLWIEEQGLRSIPRELIHVTPVRGVFPTFDIGDLIRVSADPLVMGGFDGAQRVYGRTLSWDSEGVPEIGEIMVSSDAETA